MIQSVSEKLDSLVQSLTAGAQRPAGGTTAPAGNAGVSPAVQQAKNTVDAKNPAVTEAVAKINSQLSVSNPKVSLSVDQETNQVLIRYKDPQSGEVVRQIPSDSVLAMEKQLNKLKGTIFNSQG